MEETTNAVQTRSSSLVLPCQLFPHWYVWHARAFVTTESCHGVTLTPVTVTARNHDISRALRRSLWPGVVFYSTPCFRSRLPYVLAPAEATSEGFRRRTAVVDDGGEMPCDCRPELRHDDADARERPSCQIGRDLGEPGHFLRILPDLTSHLLLLLPTGSR